MKIFMSLAAAGLAFATPSHSQQNCAPRDVILDHLAELFGEVRQSIGIAPEGRVVEVFASPETRTWTITITSPSGTTCLIASGQSFEKLAEELRPTGVKS